MGRSRLFVSVSSLPRLVTEDVGRTDSGHGMPRAPASGHLLGSLVAHQLLKTVQPFRLPSHFPRHYLTTVSGEPEIEARLPTERGWQEAKEGWVWVDESAKSSS